PQSGVTLPGVTLTDDGAFEELFDQVEQRITALRSAGNTLTGAPLMNVKKHLLEHLLPNLESLRRGARWRKRNWETCLRVFGAPEPPTSRTVLL
ncbi:MAG: hypothetical protein L6Q76_31315, partial [Polyangiaceae bacterium]|nr:hypothetical protein [Polyangiaceae bacterium]